MEVVDQTSQSETQDPHSAMEPGTPTSVEKIESSWTNDKIQNAITPNKTEDDTEAKKENMIVSTEKMPVVKMETPEAVRTRREQQANLAKIHVSSPSDSMLSPCTTKLFGNKDSRRNKATGPAALLRKKQQGAIPCNLNDED